MIFLIRVHLNIPEQPYFFRKKTLIFLMCYLLSIAQLNDEKSDEHHNLENKSKTLIMDEINI